MEIIEYEAIELSEAGILSYPTVSTCSSIPCLSWDIAVHKEFPSGSPFTFKIEAKSNHGHTYKSGLVKITIL